LPFLENPELSMLATMLKCSPPSVESATGTTFSTLNRYVIQRLPKASNDRLGSQQDSPRLSLPSATMRLVHVFPPSKLTPRNIPETPSAMFVKITTFCGLVGLTAIAVSDSLPTRWLTSTFAGGDRGARGAAPAQTAETDASRTTSDASSNSNE
jgi:hypothetical protein